MKIGISRISNTPEEAYRVLESAHRYGFAGVQLKPPQYNDFVAAPQSFKERYGSLSYLACGGLIVYPGGDPSTWRTQVDAVLPFAGAVDAGHICLCSGVYETGASEEQVRAVANALTDIGTTAKQQGVVISIHNHMDSLVESEEDIARLLDIVDPALCGLTLDTAHAAKAGISNVANLALRFKAHLLNVHLKDIAGDGQFCALGQGTLALRPILDALASVQYDQWLIVDEETKNLSTEETFGIASDCLQAEGIPLKP
jgi:sugar phosphate isomerase/epimerase